MKKIIVIGGGDLGKKAISLITRYNLYEIIGYTDIVDRKLSFDIPYLGDDKEIEKFRKDKGEIFCVMGIGLINNELVLRRKIYNRLRSLGMRFPIIISPAAIIHHSSIRGEGSIIFDNAYIDFESKCGELCLININSILCHNTQIGDNTIISPQAICGGRSVIGDNVFIGIGTTIKNCVNIIDNTLIGAGAVVVKDIFDSGIYVGNPAKKLRGENEQIR
ncbi:MAG: NeuD/PglB/VioB family sugar acetyltransferase [Saprospiraceae bacterium]|nr:NeuD/PglB/VioB family sugar acetyltransferase [Saprospiraceae bacterium]